MEPCACGTRTIAWFKNVLEHPVYDKSFDNRIRFIQTNVSLYRTVSCDILGTVTAPVSACLQPTRRLAARTGRGKISQAGKHTSSKRRYHTNTTRNKMKNMLYFFETTHEVAETVIFRQYVPVKSRVPLLQNEDSSCSIRECDASNTASTPNISDVCAAAAAVDTACARGSVLLITTSMSVRTRALSLETIIFRMFAPLLLWMLLVLGAPYC